jgi:TonB family protein
MLSHGQKNKKATQDLEQLELEQLQRDADAAVNSGDLNQAIALLTENMRIQYSQKVAAQLGQIQLQNGDTIGYCISQRYLNKGRDTDASALYEATCQDRDSTTFEASGLSSSRYPGIIAVTRSYHRADGRTYFVLYGQEGIKELAFSTFDKDTLFLITARIPEFPGGESEMFKFFGTTIIYPSAAKDRGISGVVYLTFVIDRNGRIKEPEIMRGVHHAMDEESMRVVSLMPTWQPGYHAGEPVEFRLNLPLRYTLR